MNIKELETLTQIYNTMIRINTKGEDTLLMAECLQALRSFILMKDKELKEQREEE